ncbi:PREDICTED: putative ribonuclease H protein At1g65750-like [Fragaria vesca subsp. vesca]
MPLCPEKIIWEYALEWKKAHSRSSNSVNFSYTMLSWTMPPQSYYKLNIDGTRVSSSGMIGAGGVIRNHSDAWITGFQINLGVGAIDAEAWGLFHGLKLASNLHISKLEIESDSAILVHLMKSANLSLHPLGSLLNGCKSMMSQMDDVKLSHVFRESNMTADVLAKCSISNDLGLILFEEPPAHAILVFLDDLVAVTRARRTGFCFSL